MFRVFYSKLYKISQDKKHQLFIDITVTSFASYLALKKTFGWSLTAALLHVFNIAIIEWIVFGLGILCGYSAIAKIFQLITTTFPASRVRSTEVEDLAHCCFSINEELSTHIERIRTDPKSVASNFPHNHNFQSNIGIIADCLAKHMLSTLSGAKSRDLFISVYQVPAYKNLDAPRTELEYICHYPKKKDAIVSKRIVFSDAEFKDYECVRCVNEESRTRVKVNCFDYFKSKTKRHRKIKHYIGMKLMYSDTLLGFLNVELYNSTFFADEDELLTYVEENMLTFRYLFEYQFIKSTFFHVLGPHLK